MQALRVRLLNISSHDIGEVGMLTIQDGFLDIIERASSVEFGPGTLEEWVVAMKSAKATALVDFELINIDAISETWQVFEDRSVAYHRVKPLRCQNQLLSPTCVCQRCT
jgi:hypothetical protein